MCIVFLLDNRHNNMRFVKIVLATTERLFCNELQSVGDTATEQFGSDYRNARPNKWR